MYLDCPILTKLYCDIRRLHLVESTGVPQTCFSFSRSRLLSPCCRPVASPHEKGSMPVGLDESRFCTHIATVLRCWGTASDSAFPKHTFGYRGCDAPQFTWTMLFLTLWRGYCTTCAFPDEQRSPCMAQRCSVAIVARLGCALSTVGPWRDQNITSTDKMNYWM